MVKSTAKAVDQDPNINNSFIENIVDPNLPLPGPLNLNCPQVPMFAWAPRSDLPAIEGTIPEGNTFIDLSAFCDAGGGHTHVLSMIAYGLGLNSAVGPDSLPRGLPGFVDDKFDNLTQTISNAVAQINDGGTTQGLVTQAKNYFDSGVVNTDANAYGCAMNAIATANAFVRSNPAAFSGAAPPGNPNPAGDIDGRLGNLFMTIDVDFLLQPPNFGWPTSNVPPCMTFTATPASVIAPATAQLTWSSGTGPYQAASCTLSASDGTFTTPMTFAGASGSVSTGTLSHPGTYSAQLICSNTTTSAITSFAQTTVGVLQLSAISVGPAAPPPQVAAGGTVQLSATGTYSDHSTKDVTSSVSWTSADTDRGHGDARGGARDLRLRRVNGNASRHFGHRHHSRGQCCRRQCSSDVPRANAQLNHRDPLESDAGRRKHLAIGGNRELLLRFAADIVHLDVRQHGCSHGHE